MSEIDLCLNKLAEILHAIFSNTFSGNRQFFISIPISLICFLGSNWQYCILGSALALKIEQSLTWTNDNQVHNYMHHQRWTSIYCIYLFFFNLIPPWIKYTSWPVKYGQALWTFIWRHPEWPSCQKLAVKTIHPCKILYSSTTISGSIFWIPLLAFYFNIQTFGHIEVSQSSSVMTGICVWQRFWPCRQSSLEPAGV